MAYMVMEKNRVEAFSDGVFAIVMTLLVFQLKLPAIEGNHVFGAIRAIGPNILCFILSFLVIGIYWVAHHTLFHLITKVDRNVLWLNNILLLTVVFLPFPTSVLAEHPMESHAIIFYAAAFSFVNLATIFLWMYVWKKDYIKTQVTKQIKRRVVQMQLLPIAIYGIGAAFASVEPIAVVVFYIAVSLFYLIPNPVIKRLMKPIRQLDEI